VRSRGSVSRWIADRDDTGAIANSAPMAVHRPTQGHISHDTHRPRHDANDVGLVHAGTGAGFMGRYATTPDTFRNT